VRGRARLLARLRMARAHLRTRGHRHAREPRAGDAGARRPVRRSGHRKVRRRHGRRRPRLPALAPARSGLPDRTTDAHRAVQRRGELPDAEPRQAERLMSSILDALKELESDKARATKKTTSVADVPSTPPRSLAPFIALGGTLAIGIVAFGV